MAVVVLAVGQVDATRACLRSLRAHPIDGQRALLVENGTTEVHAALAHEFPDVTWLRLPRNEGFAGGCARGIDYARRSWAPDAYFLLNNDAVVTPGALHTLLEAMRGDARIGMVTPKIYADPDRRVLWGAAGEWDAWRCLARDRGRGEVDRGQWDQQDDVEMSSACALLVRAKTLDDIGSFDERFFCYGEDVDLCRRARERGWRVVYVPRAVVHHAGSLTSGSEYAPFQSFYRWRNRLLTIVKRSSGVHRVLLVGMFLPALVARDTLRYARHGHARSIPYLYRGLVQSVAILLGRRVEPMRR